MKLARDVTLYDEPNTPTVYPAGTPLEHPLRWEEHCRDADELAAFTRTARERDENGKRVPWVFVLLGGRLRALKPEAIEWDSTSRHSRASSSAQQ